MEKVTYFRQTKEGTQLEKPLAKKPPDWHTMTSKLFPRKKQTLAIAVDLENAYNRMQFKLLIELPIPYGISLTLARWLAVALQ